MQSNRHQNRAIHPAPLAVALLLAFCSPLSAGQPSEFGHEPPHGPLAATANRELLEGLLPDSTGSPHSIRIQAWTHFIQGELLRGQRRYSESIEEFRSAIALEPDDAAVALELAWTRLEAGQVDSARVESERLARLDPESFDARTLLARCLLTQRKGRESIPWLEEAHHLDPDDEWVLLNLLNVYQNLGREEDALALIEPAIPPNLATPALYFRRAGLRLRADRFDEAMEDLAEVVKREPEYPRAKEQLLRMAIDANDPLASVALLEELLEVQPGVAEIRRAVVGVLATSPRWKDAIPHLEALLEQRPDSWRVRLQLGLLLLRGGEVAAAETQIRQASELDRRDPEPFRWLWRIASEREDWEQAQIWSDSLLARAPGDLQGLWTSGFTLFQRGNHEKALEVLEKALVIAPEHRESAFLAAALLEHEGEFPRAAAHLGRLIESEPENQQALLRLGILRERLGEFEPALELFERVLRLDPNNDLALNYAGYMCIERGVRLEQSMRRIKRALDQQPGNPAYQDSYGWGYYQMGQPERAIPPLLKAVEGDSTNVLILKHLGMAYEKANRSTEARDTYRRVLEIDPEDSEVQDWIEQLGP